MEIFQKILLDPLFPLKKEEISAKKYGAVPSKLFTFDRITPSGAGHCMFCGQGEGRGFSPDVSGLKMEKCEEDLRLLWAVDVNRTEEQDILFRWTPGILI